MLEDFEGCCEDNSVASDRNKSRVTTWAGLSMKPQSNAKVLFVWGSSELSNFSGDLWTSTVNAWVDQSKLSRFPGRES